jgi:transcriptional regulator with XRE-family HTH domain
MALDYAKLGQVVADLRERRSLSRPEVARSIGVTSTFLGMVESGKRTLSTVTLEKLAEVFGVPAEFITCLAAKIPGPGDEKHRFAKVMQATQKAMLAAIDAEESLK